MKQLILPVLLMVLSCTVYAQNEKFDFLDPTLPLEERFDQLVSQITLQEKEYIFNPVNQKLWSLKLHPGSFQSSE
jgi:hypothetical protein